MPVIAFYLCIYGHNLDSKFIKSLRSFFACGMEKLRVPFFELLTLSVTSFHQNTNDLQFATWN